jgi:hypothetical protein
VTPVFVEVEGGLTAFVNPACFAADAGTSALVEGFDAEDEASAAGTKTIDPTSGTTAAPRLAATRFRVSFLTSTQLSKEGGLKPDRARGDSIRIPAGFGEEGSPTARY